MMSQTFKARMAVGSWVNSPVCPPLPELEKIIQRASNSKSANGNEVARGKGSESGEDFGDMSADDEENEENFN
jgi:hypothetical protein